MLIEIYIQIETGIKKKQAMLTPETANKFKGKLTRWASRNLEAVTPDTRLLR